MTDKPGWQPIETAPKDGTHIIAWQATDGMRVSWFEGGMWQNFPWRSRRINPTHWMPLPEPPA